MKVAMAASSLDVIDRWFVLPGSLVADKPRDRHV
jgi:hypothetical protein